MNDFTNILPEMLFGKQLRNSLECLPVYDEAIRQENIGIRLMALSALYSIYIPSEMSEEIYSKLYLSILHSLEKKSSKLAVIQRNENFRAKQSGNYNGIIGGSDSFTVIGESGIGKSSAIMRAISLISEKTVIEIEKPYVKIIPCIVCQCPHDCSTKNLLLEILRQVDLALGSDYYKNALRTRDTVDMLIGNVSQLALNHIGVLVIDEIQNVYEHRYGSDLVAMLTQLINNSGISICMVGTPESVNFFEGKMQLARRSLGLCYGPVPYNKFFREFCATMFSYQYVKQKTEITDYIMEWLYEHSAGMISVVVFLLHDAQELSIMNGREILDIKALNEAFDKRMQMLHPYINPGIKKRPQSSKAKKTSAKEKHMITSVNGKTENVKEQGYASIPDMVKMAKANNEDILFLMKKQFPVVEVKV